MSTAGADLAMATVNRSNKSRKKEAAFELFARGYSHPEISRELAISIRTLSRWRGDYEIQINSRAAINFKSDSEIAITAQDTRLERINDLFNLAFDRLKNVLADDETKKTDLLRAISIAGEWARVGRPIPTDQKTECEFPFPTKGTGPNPEFEKLSDAELREVYFESLRET